MRKTPLQRLEEGQTLSKVVKNTKASFEKFASRLKKRITHIIEHEYSYFITFTISNEHLGHIKNTYERKIKEALSSASSWVFNEDFGPTTNRLHYHSIVCYDSQLDYNTLLGIYKYGSIDIERIKARDEKSLREYISKQVNHASKDSAQKVFYSRIKTSRWYEYD